MNTYTIREHDGVFDVLSDDLIYTGNLQTREEAEATILQLKREDAIADLAETNIQSSINNLMKRFGLTREHARKVLRDALS